jgi:phthalate 4,5-dioxygenase oxygenase subunit
LDHAAMRAQREQFIALPDYVPRSGRLNDWGFNPEEQLTDTYLGMGQEDINLHDQWAVESMGPIQDRTRETLGTSDKVIMANRRTLLQAIDTVRAGGSAPCSGDPALAGAIRGPDTVDGIAPAGTWPEWWVRQAAAKRAGAPWMDKVAARAELA